MSRETAALKFESVPMLPKNGMVLGELDSSRASSLLAANVADDASAMQAGGGVDSKEAFPVTTSQTDERINFGGMGYNSQPVIVKLNAGSESQEQAAVASGIAYLKQRNGISGSFNDQRRIDSPKRPNNNQIHPGGWPLQNGQVDGHGQPVGRLGRPTENRTTPDVSHSRRNDMKWMVSSERRTNSNETPRQNLGEKKSVKILQRPSSVTKILVPDAAVQGNQDGDLSMATHQKKGRKKTLSLNPDELEDLEILIEQVLKDGIEETNTDSEDDDVVIETLDRKDNVNDERKTSPEKPVFRNSEKTEREAKMELAKNSVIRNETGAKGRKFVKETGKNVGRGGRDQGRRRENFKTKDNNHRSGNFQPRRSNEVSSPAPAVVEDDKTKQSMTNVYPAQLKVALKHMDSLPPRFQRRLQTGMSQISGSDPALSKLMEEISSPADNHSASSFGCKDLDKSRDRVAKKSIRNLLALYDEETVLPSCDPFARRLSYSMGAAGEHENPNLLNALQDASLNVSNPNANGSSVDLSDANKPVSLGDPFRARPSPIFQQKPPLDKMFLMNGGYVADPLAADSSAGYGKNFAQWHLDRSAAASPLPGPRKTTFSVNAPEFVSTLFPSSNPTANGELRRGIHAIPGSMDGVASLGFTNDANPMLAGQPLPSNMVGYRNNMVQPDYTGATMAGQSAQFSAMSVTPGRNIPLDPSFGPMAPPGANFPQRQRLMGMNMVPYTSVPMPYDTSPRGFLPQQQQVFVPPMSNQLYAGNANMQMTSAAGDLSPMQWYSGGAPSNQLDGGASSVAPGGIPYGGRIGPSGADGWPSKGFLQQPLSFEVGRQKILRLVGEGNFVMVILIGRMDGNKLSMFSELQNNATGSFVLNLRNGMCPSSEEKILEMHQWNYKLALEAVEAHKNPIIIDHPFAQQWQLRDYIGLAQMSSYFVEIVNCDDGGQFRGIPNMGSNNWDEWRPNVPPQLTVNDVSASGGLNRYNIPSVMNSVYYLPSATASSGVMSQQQPQPILQAEHADASIQNVLLPVPNM